MTTHYVLNTKGAPLERFREFLGRLYEAAKLDAMLVPLRVSSPASVEPCIVERCDEVQAADPFTPIMLLNAARLLMSHIENQPDHHLGAVLRPCELRALNTLAKRNLFAMDGVLTVGVDCIGTFAADALEEQGSPKSLMEESLRFARQGGINMYRYRSACQMCVNPTPVGADITVDLLGLPVRHVIVIGVEDTELLEQIDLGMLADGSASPDLIEQHRQMQAQVRERRTRARDRLVGMLNDELSMDVDQLVAHINDCDQCQTCLEVCPIYGYAVEAKASLTRDEVMEWLLGCAGCGMCEAACGEHLPLTRIFTRIREEVAISLSGIPTSA